MPSKTRKKASPGAKPAPKTKPTSAIAAKIQKIGLVPASSVAKHTGKNWDEWIELLEKAGARAWTYQETAAFLVKRHKLSAWWRHEVARGYELHVGKRIEGQNLKGEYSTTATKTFPIDAKAAWKLLFSEQGLATWLGPVGDFTLKPGAVYEVEGGAYGQVRTLQKGKRARLSWQESHWRKPSFIQVYVLPRAKGKSMVVIQHDSLASAEIKAQLKERWRKAVDELCGMAASGKKA